jgi:hypothetical protein
VWVDLSERCTDSATGELLGSPLAVAALEDLREEQIQAWIFKTRERSWEGFARRYLVASGDRFQWRPDRVGKLDDLVRRTRVIAREIEARERGVGVRELPPEVVLPLDQTPIAIDETVVSRNEKEPDLVGRLRSAFVDGRTILLNLRVPASPGEEARDVAIFAEESSFRYVGLEKDQQKPFSGYIAYVWLKADSQEKAQSVRFAREK